MDEWNENESQRPPEKALLGLFGRTSALLQRYWHIQARQSAHDPSRGQGRVLSILRIKPEISQKDLAYLLDMRSQSLGELLGKLERAGYVTRTPSEEDRRMMTIRLTDAGQAAADQAERNQGDNGRLFQCLSPEEQARLAGFLNRLISQMENEMDAGYDTYWEDAKQYREDARQYQEDMRRHGQAMRDQARARARDLRDQMREHGRELRDQARELRRGIYQDMYQDGGWGGPPDRDGPSREEEPGWNGPRRR